MQNLKTFFLALILLLAHSSAYAMLRIEVCGGANDVRECKPGVDNIRSTTGATTGEVDVRCEASSTTCTAKPAQVMVNEKAALETPAGWSSPVHPGTEPSAPATATRESLPSIYVPTGSAANMRAAISSNCVITYNSAAGNYVYLAPSTSGCGFEGFAFNGNQMADPPTLVFQSAVYNPSLTGYSCPNYSGTNSGSCSLSNSSLVQKPSDGKCTIKRIGNTFSGDLRDPDCTINPSTTITSTSVTIKPTPTAAENKRFDFMPDGSGKITSTVPNADGTTTVRTVTFGTPNASTGESLVSGTSESVYKGTGSSQGTTPSGELPTDYNRESTQQEILAQLKLKKGIDETGTPTDASLTEQKNAFDEASTSRILALEGVANRTDLGFGLSITWPVSSCNDPTFAIPGTGKTLMIPMCAKRPDIQLGMNWLVSLLAAFSIFHIGASAIAGKQ